MVLPRNSFLGNGGGDRLGVLVQGSKRKLTFKSAARDVMKGLSLNEIMLGLEPFLRKVVREEVDRAILPFLTSSPTPRPLNQIEQARGRGLCLQFIGKLPSTIFTGSRVEAEDGTRLKIALFDATNETVVSFGPFSSIKLEIVALDGDFGADEQEDWTENKFNARVLREREGKRPLVTGELNVTLKDGIGTLGDVFFTDNSSWIKCRKFRLGARILQRISGEVTIREARTEAFVVKDHRGEAYKKHYPPYPTDEVWRLERIAKDGAFCKRLALEKVETVKDFLRLNATDPITLRNILGGGISNRTWDAIIDHATTCVLDDDELYAYHGVAQRVVLLLNSIYKVVAASFDGQNFLPLEELTLTQKLLVDEVKRQAYKNIHEFTFVDRRAIMGPSRPLATLQFEPSNSPNLGPQEHDFSVALQGEPEMQLAFSQSPNSASYTYESEGSHQLQAFNPTLRNSFIMRDLFPIPYNGENGWSQTFLPASVIPGTHLANDDISDAQMPNWSLVNTGWDLGNGFCNESHYGIPLLISKSRAGWCKIRAAFKWMSVGRDGAAKKLGMGSAVCM
ncbi:hypothetical protein SLE2022_125580 [Rubroshorea leprosula]